MAMSKQEIFDRVATHLLTQGHRSTESKEEDSRCLYKGRGNDRCAVGCLIHDQYYRRDLEGHKASHDFVEQALFHSGVLQSSMANTYDDYQRMGLLCRLQEIHDRYSPSEWRSELRAVASAGGVDTDAVEGFYRPMYHPTFHDDAHELAEREAMYAAQAVCTKAQTVERKTLTEAPELVI